MCKKNCALSIAFYAFPYVQFPHICICISFFFQFSFAEIRFPKAYVNIAMLNLLWKKGTDILKYFNIKDFSNIFA